MPLYQAALTIVTVLYLEFPNAIFTNYRVQNAAARLVVQESRFCHITPLLKSLHWLPVKYRIVFKILLITFKVIHGLAPAYISELISVRDASGRPNLRSNNGLRLNYSLCKSLATLRDRSFHVAAPKLWNDLPCSLRNIISVCNFKKAIKTRTPATLLGNGIYGNGIYIPHFLYVYNQMRFTFNHPTHES